MTAPSDGELRELAEAMAAMPVQVAACASCGTPSHGYVPYCALGQPEAIQAVLSGLERNPIGERLALYLIATVEPAPEHPLDGSEPAQVYDVAAGRLVTEGTLQECVTRLSEGLLCLCRAGNQGVVP